MLRFLKNIVKYLVTGFLLIAVSGFTFVIHHEHSIETSVKKHTEHSHNEKADGHYKNNPSTYHEVHFVKFSSGDQFNIAPTTDLRSSLLTLFVIQPELFDSFTNFPSSTLVTATDWEYHPPSEDKCVLFCSFLI